MSAPEATATVAPTEAIAPVETPAVEETTPTTEIPKVEEATPVCIRSPIKTVHLIRELIRFVGSHKH